MTEEAKDRMSYSCLQFVFEEFLEEAWVGGGEGGETSAIFDGGDGGGVGILGLDLEGHLVGQNSGGGVLAKDVGALRDGPDGRMVRKEVNFVDSGFKRRPKLRRQMVEDETCATKKASGGVSGADGVFLAF